MTKKEAFINIVQTVIFDSGETFNFSDKELNDALEFFEELKNNKTKNSKDMTENGVKLLSWMQENVDTMTNLFTSKEIAEALFTSGRSIAGSMRKLVNDGYVEKIGKDPVQYSLTEAGKNYKFEN
jgi:predicted HTH transcriptional regulator